MTNLKTLNELYLPNISQTLGSKLVKTPNDTIRIEYCTPV